MTNLKDETLKILAKHGHTADDVVWVGTLEFAIDKELFWRLADRLYDDGFGGQEVARDLLVVGESWWLERHSYGGAEWWEYKIMPAMPDAMKPVERVIRDADHWWLSLYGMNQDDWHYCE